MRPPARRFALGALVATCALATACERQPPATTPIPERLSDEEFWRLSSSMSEPGGSFRSDNFVSNERMFQFVIPDLQRTFEPGGVYLGVGPDQNFTYIVALRPQIAFIVDIRRQNMMQHLMYKALIEMSSDRADFLSKLFSRPRPPFVDSTYSANALFMAYEDVEPSSELFVETLAAIQNHLTKTHGFALSEDDLRSIDYVFSAFKGGGPNITYSYPSLGRGRGPRGMPTYADLQVLTDDQGVNRAYLGSEENFRILKDLESRNLIVPVVGDFAGKKALRAVGRYLREHGAVVSAFYTSNVEQYLFMQDDDWRRFLDNVATLPVDEESTFIRALAQGRGGLCSAGVRLTKLHPIAEAVREYKGGRIRRYCDVIEASR